VDFNDDGQIDFGEKALPALHRPERDRRPRPGGEPQPTDGCRRRLCVPQSPPRIVHTHRDPAGRLHAGHQHAWHRRGTQTLDQFFVTLGNGRGRPQLQLRRTARATGSIQKGQTATIGFWNNKNGQALIKSLPVVTNEDGSVTSVANWLAATLPNTFESTPAII